MNSNKLFYPLIAGLLLLGAWGGAGCRKLKGDVPVFTANVGTKSDSVLFYNLLPDSAGVNNMGYVLYVNDSLYYFMGQDLGGIQCYGTPGSFSVPASGGTFTFQLVEFSNAAIPPIHLTPNIPVHVQKTLSFAPHSGVSYLLFVDSAGKPVIDYIPVGATDPGAPQPGAFKLRVINYGYDMPSSYPYGSAWLASGDTTYALQLQAADSTVIPGQTRIPFGTISSWSQFQYGTYQFLLYSYPNDFYLSNCGPLGDVTAAFDLEYYYTSLNSTYLTYVFPHLNNFPSYRNHSTTEAGNIGSYPFAAGGCYSILVIGSIYTVHLDKQYGAGTLDNFGKLQAVNAAPDWPKVQVSISGAGQSSSTLAYGGYTPPVMVPAGEATCTFTAKGQTLASYTTTVDRLADYTLYLTEDANHVPLVYPITTDINDTDYVDQSGVYPPAPNTVQAIHVSFLNLCPDGGNLFFTDHVPQYGIEARVSGDLAFKGLGSQQTFEGLPGYWPDMFGLRLSLARADSLSGTLQTRLANPFPWLTNPGSYTLVASGRYNETDTAKGLRLFLVKQSNFTPKAL